MNFVALDFETATSERSSVCSIGIAVVEDGVIVDKAYWLVKPRNNHFDPYNTYIHGISAKDVMNEPEFCDLWPQIKPYLENRIVLAHNASFDMSVLRYVLDESEIPYPTLSYSCSWMISKKHWPELSCHKLNFISEQLGIQFKHHNALEDATACAQIVIQVCKEKGSISMDNLVKEFGFTMGGLYPGGYKTASQGKGSSKIKPIKPRTTDFDPAHPFYAQNFVFTGTLQSISRKAAMQIVVDHGGYCCDSVNTETHYLVVGVQDFTRFKNGQKSSKTRKAELLISSGLSLKMIGEKDFLGMV